MKSSHTIDQRLFRIQNILDRFLAGDFMARESFEEEGDELDLIISKLNELAARVQASGKLIADYEKRVTAIMNVLLRYTLFDFSEKASISAAGDEIDAIALALNTLGEELEDRIRDEKKHRENLEKLAAVVETTADAVVSLDSNFKITHWNKSAERIYGYTAEEMLGKSPLSFTPDDEAEKTRQILNAVKSGKQIVDLHSKRVRKDGQVRDISITFTPIFGPDGEVSSISALSRDITEQKKAEQILKESEERFRGLVDSVKDYAIIMLDPEGRVTTWNKGAEAIKGYQASDVLGQHFSMFYTEEDRRAGLPQRLIEKAVREGKSTHEGFRLQKNGQPFWGYVVITSLYDDKGRLTGFSKITRDLSEIKKKDDEIIKYTLRLEQKNQELERINKELASFAYVSSHDLQEPLRKIQTFASRILETDFDRLSDAGQNYFQRMNSSANRMQQLILDILDYSRLSSSEQKVETIGLKEMLDEVLEDLREQLEEKKGEVICKSSCPLQVVPYQFKQLLSNLLSNAIKFAKNDQPPVVEISCKTERADADLRHKLLCEKCCHIVVKDNGIGFEPHFATQIFEVFQRLHNQEVYPGTGIGLAICKKIVDNHQGAIKAESELDKGATFHIWLPAKQSG